MPPIAELERLELESNLVDRTFREEGPSPLLEGAILICKDLPAHAHKARQDLWRLWKAKQVDDLQESGERFLRAIDLAIQATALYAHNTAMPLEDVQIELQQIRQQHLERWPWFRQEDVDQALAEAARGETVDLEEAFAGLAGISKEEWNNRVEAYQRNRNIQEGP